MIEERTETQAKTDTPEKKPETKTDTENKQNPETTEAAKETERLLNLPTETADNAKFLFEKVSETNYNALFDKVMGDNATLTIQENTTNKDQQNFLRLLKKYAESKGTDPTLIKSIKIGKASESFHPEYKKESTRTLEFTLPPKEGTTTPREKVIVR